MSRCSELLGFAVILTLTLSGCTSSEFAGGDKTKKSKSGPQGEDVLVTDADSDRRDEVDKEEDAGDADRDRDNDIDNRDDEEIEIEDAVTTKRKLCETKDGKVNVSFVFDNTASMSDGEVETIRDSALQFMESLSDIALADDAPEFNFSVVVFDDSAWNPSNGWTAVASNNDLSTVRQHISTAMNPDNKGGASVPDEGLNIAKGLFEDLNTSVDEEAHRNFVILYSDAGLEEDHTGPQAVAHAKTLAEDFGAAIYTIVLGNIDPNDDEERHFFDMAQPKTGIVSDNHKGVLMSSGSSGQMRDFFATAADNLLDDCD